MPPRGAAGARIRDLGQRNLVAQVEGGLAPPEALAAYFLLEQAILDQLGEGPRRGEASQLVRHFFKQLAVVMLAELTARERRLAEQRLRERDG
ncbi:hypothetical protein D3C72_2243600 [compost metagenome]